MSYLTFTKQPRAEGRKTDKWTVTNNNGGLLGHVEFWAHWRWYVFMPDVGSIFDAVCLIELSNFCEAQTKERKTV